MFCSLKTRTNPCMKNTGGKILKGLWELCRRSVPNLLHYQTQAIRRQTPMKRNSVDFSYYWIWQSRCSYRDADLCINVMIDKLLKFWFPFIYLISYKQCFNSINGQTKTFPLLWWTGPGWNGKLCPFQDRINLVNQLSQSKWITSWNLHKFLIFNSVNEGS